MAEIYGPPDPKNDDQSVPFLIQHESRQGNVDAEEMLQKYGSETPVLQPDLPSDPANPEAAGSDIGDNIKAVAKDVGRGVTEIPLQTLGGLRDAAQSTINSVYDLGDWLSTKMPALGAGIAYDPEKGVQLLGAEDFKKFQEKAGGKIAPQLPEGKEAESVTGGMVHGVAQFLGGMYSGGKMLKSVSAVSKFAKFGKLALQGAIADFTAFEGADKKLSDLVEAHPELHNPITEFLKSDPNDSKVEGRFKRAVEGVAAGALTTGAIQGLTKGLRTIQLARAMEAEQRIIQKAAGGSVPYRELRPDELAPLGVPGGKLIEKMNPADVLEKGKPEVFINFARIEAPEDIKAVMQQMANKSSGEIADASRGVRSWEQTKLSAEQEDAWKLLSSRRQGDAMNAEQSLAARQLWASSGEKLTELAKLARDVPSEANLFSFRKMLATHNAIQKEVLAARTETARALNAWKIPAGSSKEAMAQMDELLQASGGSQATRELAEKVAVLAENGKMYQLDQLVEKGAFAKSRDAVLQTWINVNLLTNPATHVANVASNWLVLANTMMERTNAAFISKMLGQDAGVELGESFAMAKAITGGMSDGLRASKEAFTTGKSRFGLMTSKVSDAADAGALSSETFNIAKDTPLGRSLDVLDTATRAPGRLLGSSDEFFKSIGYRAEVHAQATRQVSQEVSQGILSKENMAARLKELTENPPENIRIEAVNAAKYTTFANKPNETLERIASSLQNVPVIGRLLIPFKNTPINILTYSMERTPLAPLSQAFRADLQAGGARASLALSKMATGTTMMATAMDLALSGQMTGAGPSEPSQKALFLRSGKQPYSYKVGDKWVAYSRLDPIGMTLGYAADIAESMVAAGEEIDQEDFEKVFLGSVFSISKNVLSKSYMKSMSNFFQAVADPDRNAESFAKLISGSIVPAGVNALVKTGIPGVVEADPNLRVADDMIQNLRKRIPGLSQDLPLYRDVWGRTVNTSSDLGKAYDLFSPVYIRRENPEPVDSELLRLNYFPQMPQRKMSISHVEVELSSKEFSRFMELAGNEYKHPAWNMGAKDFMNSLVTGKNSLSPVYEMLPDDKKSAMIEEWISKYRDGAKRQLLEESGSVKAKYEVSRRIKNPLLYPPDAASE